MGSGVARRAVAVKHRDGRAWGVRLRGPTGTKPPRAGAPASEPPAPPGALGLRTPRRDKRRILYAIAFVVFFAFLTLILRGFVATDPDATPLADPTLRTPADGPAESAPPNPPREPDEG